VIGNDRRPHDTTHCETAVRATHRPKSICLRCGHNKSQTSQKTWQKPLRFVHVYLRQTFQNSSETKSKKPCRCRKIDREIHGIESRSAGNLPVQIYFGKEAAQTKISVAPSKSRYPSKTANRASQRTGTVTATFFQV
jgi:hypothetical protein